MLRKLIFLNILLVLTFLFSLSVQAHDFWIEKKAEKFFYYFWT